MRTRTISLLLCVLFGSFCVAQQRPFPPADIELSEAQREQVEKLRADFEKSAAELRRVRNAVFTAEQNQTRREALATAREKKLDRREAQQLVQEAVKLTDEQQKQLSDVREQLGKAQDDLQRGLFGVLTQEQRQKIQRDNPRPRGQGGGRVAPTHANVKYGDHERHVMDVWLAESDKPTPVLVSIHGGGFRGGNKSVDGALLNACLENGISVCAITYRLSQHAIAPASFHDSARAIQFIRSKSKEWNLDKERFASTGGSAGAGLSLWLGFRDDLADSDADDPVARESTRLSCMVVYNGQTSYDPRVIRKLFPENDTYKHSALAQLYDVDLGELDDLPKEKYALFEECSALPHLTKDDPPAMLFYGVDYDTPISNQSVGIHHPRFGKLLKKQMDELEIECIVHTRSSRQGGSNTERTLAFIKKHFEN